jgi:large subunit ribosomal protein L18
MAVKTSREQRIHRHRRVRRRVSGTPERPRLAVFRSLSHVYAQVIDDVTGRTLAAASDLDEDVAGEAKGKPKTARAELVGAAIARRASAAGVEKVVFDRGGFLYHGRVKALAEAARKGGLIF